MNMPPPVNPGYGMEYGQPVLPVHEWAPGVEVVQALPGVPGVPSVNIMSEMGPGVRPVFFVGGLPPHLDPAGWQAQQALQAGFAAHATAMQARAGFAAHAAAMQARIQPASPQIPARIQPTNSQSVGASLATWLITVL